MSAGHGAEALEKARQDPPDLTISDILMPVMDGFALCREFKKDARLKSIPFVFYTATYTDERDREFALSLGAARFIVKPEEPAAFMEIIRETIGQAGGPPGALATDGLDPLPAEVTEKEETVYLKQYNETLIRKLEAKMEELEKTNYALEQDIAMRRATEEALRQGEIRLRRFYDSGILGVIYWNMDGTITEANDKFLEMVGYTREDLEAGQVNWLAMTPPEYRNLDDLSIAELKDAGVSKMPREKEYIRKDGSRIPVIMAAAVLDNECLNGVAFVLDITAFKKAVADRERLLAAIEQAGEVIIITNSEGIIQYVNPAFETATGYTREEALGQNPRILKSGRHDDDFYKDLWTTITSGRTWQGTIVNKRKDGKIYTESATISPVRNPSGSIINYAAVKRDITEQIRLTDQLQQAQKMESVGRLAGGVAHDFNNILTAILGYAQLAMTQGRSPEQIQEDLKIIESSALHSADLVRQLLAFARKQTIAPKVLNLNDTVSDMIKILRRMIGEDISFGWMPGTGLWSVKIDPSQLDQLLANLCVNARDAISRVGTITIETDNAVLDKAYCDTHSGFVPGEYVMIVVSDNGSGMSKDIVAQIFEPFFTTKEVGKGTGLGLATVYGIVKQNNGFVNVYSEPGKGTTFRIYLPRFQGEAMESSTYAPMETPKAKGETVLVVEDDAVILMLGKAILEAHGYKVLTAGLPGEALQLAKAHRHEIDLLITDVVMPEMNGRDLANMLIETIPGLKCLFASGYTADAIVHQGVLDEGVNFIEKPFSVKSLATKVREVLEQT
jgi:PAS domain S-box-containing protein